jgi:chemotaxis protein methyltransferase CheR
MISAPDYLFLTNLLKDQSGLALNDSKTYLLESRLVPLAESLGYADLAALVESLRKNPPSMLVKRVCDAMTTNETLFFRDTTPFTVLQQQLMPAAIERARAANRPVRIWCAACSTGQEVYSVAMTVDAMRAELGSTQVEIRATDYSTAALQRARAGVYSQLEVQRGLPVNLLLKHFREAPNGFEVLPELKSRIRFGEANLLEPFAVHGYYDIIFVRNVLIYFDVASKRDVLERMCDQLYPGGSIILGGTETTLGITQKLSRDLSMTAPVYVKTELATALAA